MDGAEQPPRPRAAEECLPFLEIDEASARLLPSTEMMVGFASLRSTLLTSIPAAMALVPAVAMAAPTEQLTNPLEVLIDGDCNYCHNFNNPLKDAGEPEYAPFAGWQGSMMANAARDPVFWAGVAVAAEDAAVPEETEDCIRCHSPRAFLEGRGDATSVDQLIPADLESVTCELCHRMEDDGIIGNARFTLDDTLVGETVARRGPWDYTDGVPVPAEHATMQSDFTGSSELCGVCHDVSTSSPRLDDGGNEISAAFNEQRTYSEWANSAFAVPGEDFRTCQDCHMPEIPDSAGCNVYQGKHQHPVGNRRHDLVGANRFMLEILRDNFGEEIGIGALNDSIDRLDEFVQTAATLDVVAPKSVDASVGIDGLEVTVTNETGHKLPSGYSEGRVMWIEVVGRYGDEVVFSSGAWDQEAGSIEDDDQLRSYEGIADQLSSGETFHLLLNDHWVEDTRIPPRGLTANLDTDPVTDRYAMQGDGTWEHWDTQTYAFAGRDDVVDATPEDSGDDELQLSVRVLYLINTPSYIDFLESQSTAGAEVAAMFDQAGGAVPVVLAEQTLALPLSGLATEAGSSGGSSGSTSGPSSSTGPGTTTSNPGSTSQVTTESTAANTSGTDTDASAGGDDDGGGGCSCTSSGGAPAWSLLLLGLLGLQRKRRHPRG